MLRREYPDTLTSLNNLSNMLNRQGKYKEAEVIYNTREYSETVISLYIRDFRDQYRKLKEA
ncbi:hypothetical protein N7527_009027 [Penicillium freii]|nr:hypothetical protein N7527_009027 [Penicillium freii]